MSAWKNWKSNLGDTRPWHMISAHADKVSDEEKAVRLAICEECPELMVTRQCAKCLCFMDLKTRLGSATCPLGKW